MKKYKIILISASILIAVATLSTFAYFTPHRTLIKIREAAQKGDKEELRELVDFPSVREGMKEQLNASMLKRMAVELKDNPFAPMGIMFVGALVDRMVDSFVTPSGIASFSKGIKPDVLEKSNAQNDNTEKNNAERNIVRTNKYDGFSRFTVSFCHKDEKEFCISLKLRRDGFNWKLTSIILPDINNKPVAHNTPTYDLRDVIGYYDKIAGDQKVLIIKGNVKNISPIDKNGIRIHATVSDSAGNILAKRLVYAGIVVPTERLRAMGMEEVTMTLSNRFGEGEANLNIKSGKSIPFMVVFFDPPANMDSYKLEARDSD